VQFKRSIVIRCPVDKAFDYISDWRNLKSFMSNILDIEPVTYVQYGPGAAFDTVFKVGGANIPTTLEVQEFVRDQRLILRSRQGLKVLGGWEFKPTTNGTSITFSLQYELPPGLVRTAKDKELIEKDFSEAASQSLQLLKWVLESPTIKGKD
jgi:uncharacterized membrane protein